MIATVITATVAIVAIFAGHILSRIRDRQLQTAERLEDAFADFFEGLSMLATGNSEGNSKVITGKALLIATGGFEVAEALRALELSGPRMGNPESQQAIARLANAVRGQAGRNHLSGETISVVLFGRHQ
ncbi:hypothetical protein [Melissospora conviva]|uniref:hypothetical protein n=1 Tax=Melissospora conviva TaxID=3388432 RepID=UPI003C1D738B